MLTGDIYSAGHLIPPHMGLACVLLIEINPFLDLKIYSELFTSNIPRYFLEFASNNWNASSSEYNLPPVLKNSS